MLRKKVVLKNYDKKWEAEFKKIKSNLETVLTDLALEIEHVGSTSIPGLSAKPIIDIIVVIPDYKVFPIIKERLASIGYIYQGDLGIKDREAFYYSGNDGLMRRHLYVCTKDSKELKRHIGFRDYLRNNKKLREEFNRIKSEASKVKPEGIKNYLRDKKKFVDKIYSDLDLN
ncbi:MAG: GrpB family protein [Bacillota bacterium]